jgi:hypothetical protein
MIVVEGDNEKLSPMVDFAAAGLEDDALLWIDEVEAVRLLEWLEKESVTEVGGDGELPRSELMDGVGRKSDFNDGVALIADVGIGLMGVVAAAAAAAVTAAAAEAGFRGAVVLAAAAAMMAEKSNPKCISRRILFSCSNSVIRCFKVEFSLTSTSASTGGTTAALVTASASPLPFLLMASSCSTLFSKSLTYCSFLSLKALCAARFCAVLLFAGSVVAGFLPGFFLVGADELLFDCWSLSGY